MAYETLLTLFWVVLLGLFLLCCIGGEIAFRKERSFSQGIHGDKSPVWRFRFYIPAFVAFMILTIPVDLFFLTVLAFKFPDLVSGLSDRITTVIAFYNGGK